MRLHALPDSFASQDSLLIPHSLRTEPTVMILQVSPRLAARSAVAVVIVSLFAFSSFAETSNKRIRSAADSLREIMRVPEKGIPRDLLDKAECRYHSGTEEGCIPGWR